MKAHYLSNREAKVARQYAAGIITKQAELAAQRAQYLWMAAMLNAGLSAKTVNRCRWSGCRKSNNDGKPPGGAKRSKARRGAGSPQRAL